MSDDVDSATDDDLVEIGRFSTAPEAYVAAYQLDSEGFETALEDVETVTVDWQLGQGIGGVKVLVRREDVERAQAVLRKSAEKEAALEAEAGTAGQGRAIVRRAGWALLLGAGFPPVLLYALVLLNRAERLVQEGVIEGALHRRYIIIKTAFWFFVSFLAILAACLIWLYMRGDYGASEVHTLVRLIDFSVQ